jgi:hypothetical protein
VKKSLELVTQFNFEIIKLIVQGKLIVNIEEIGGKMLFGKHIGMMKMPPMT